MKIRIANNSLRFRLKQPEVSQFEKEGNVMEVVEFGTLPNEQLSFSLATTKAVQFSLSFQSGTTTIYVPQSVADEWTGTDLVGFEEKIETGKGKIIKVLVEKDFACLDRTGEENEGAYQNPKSNC